MCMHRDVPMVKLNVSMIVIIDNYAYRVHI